MALTQVQGGMVASGTITSNNVSFAANSISGSALTANTVSNTAFQTGSVENYMSAQGFGIGMRNRIINGDMRIDQRNAGASVTAGSGYTVDRWNVDRVWAGSTVTIQQSSLSPTGFANSLVATVTTGAAVASSSYFSIQQYIEGYNLSDMSFGTASAKSFTVSFWVRSSVTGAFGIGCRNSTYNLSYWTTYTINTANTWEYKTVTITGPTSGTWYVNNSNGLNLIFSLGCGTTYKVGTNNSWVAGNLIGAIGETDLIATTGATFYITGVQLEVGSVATPFEYRQYGQELALCQRYFVSYGAGSSDSGSSTFAGYWAETTIVQASAATPVPMRSSPTITLLNPTTAMSVYRPGTSQAAPGAGASATEITQTGFILNSGICSSSSTQGFGTHWRCYGSGKVIASAEL